MVTDWHPVRMSPVTSSSEIAFECISIWVIVEAKSIDSAKSEFSGDEAKIDAENCRSKYSLEYLEKLQLDLKALDGNFDHLDELTLLREVLDNVVGLPDVMPILLPGRVKWIKEQHKALY